MGGAPVLWHFRVSHFNEKVRWALDYKQWPHVRKALVPGFHVPVARRLSGQNQVPLLKIDGRVLNGSDRILEEIERLRPEPRLFPEDPAERARALELQAWCDTEIAPEWRRLFWWAYLPHPRLCARMTADGAPAWNRWLLLLLYPLLKPVFGGSMGVREDLIEQAHGRMRAHLDRLVAELRPSGYLVGNAFSVADLTAAAVMTAILRPSGFPYPLPEPWPPELIGLKAEIADHPGSRWVQEIYARHRPASCALGESGSFPPNP